MVTQKTLNSIVKKLLVVAKPERIILFGSRARKDNYPRSDIDLLIILRHFKDRGNLILQFRNAIGDVGVGVDILVYSQKEVRERSDWSSSVISWALKEGKVLYEKPRRRSESPAKYSTA